MDAWADVAVHELEVELKRLDLDADARRAGLERAQVDYDAIIAEQATVRGMLDWARKRRSQQVAASAPVNGAGGEDAGGIVLNGVGALTVPAPADVVLPAGAEPPAQTELCVKALRQFARDADTAEIRVSLEQAGYRFNQTQVRSALKYLAGKKKNPPVMAVRPGVWRLTEAMNGAGGSP